MIDGLTKVTSEENCGRPTVARRRVVNGTDAGFGSYPWQALIRVGASRCGGALIRLDRLSGVLPVHNRISSVTRPDWVVTAAHCVQGAWPGSVKVYLGESHHCLSLYITNPHVAVTQASTVSTPRESLFRDRSSPSGRLSSIPTISSLLR